MGCIGKAEPDTNCCWSNAEGCWVDLDDSKYGDWQEPPSPPNSPSRPMEEKADDSNYSVTWGVSPETIWSEVQAAEDKLKKLRHTYETDVNSLKNQIQQLENVRYFMVEEAKKMEDELNKARSARCSADASMKDWMDESLRLRSENERLRRLLSTSASELEELDSENGRLQDMIDNGDSPTKTVASVLEKSGALENQDLINELNRKETVIQKKDEKATRLIGIIREKNGEINELKNKIWLQKREGWTMSREITKMKEHQGQLNKTFEIWRNYISNLDGYIYGTLLPVWAKTHPYYVYPQYTQTPVNEQNTAQ